MFSLFRHASILVLVAWLTGCDKDQDTSTPEPVDTGACTEELASYPVSWDNWGQNFFATYCDACHASGTANRYGAPESVTFDTEEEVRNQIVRIHVRTLEDQDMPPAGGILEDELFLLDIFLRCGL